MFLIASSVPSKRSLRNVPIADAGSLDMGSKRMDGFSAAPIALAATEAPILRTANSSRLARDRAPIEKAIFGTQWLRGGHFRDDSRHEAINCEADRSAFQNEVDSG
jgi:hypothetical protein